MTCKLSLISYRYFFYFRIYTEQKKKKSHPIGSIFFNTGDRVAEINKYIESNKTTIMVKFKLNDKINSIDRTDFIEKDTGDRERRGKHNSKA